MVKKNNELKKNNASDKDNKTVEKSQKNEKNTKQKEFKPVKVEKTKEKKELVTVKKVQIESGTSKKNKKKAGKENNKIHEKNKEENDDPNVLNETEENEALKQIDMNQLFEKALENAQKNINLNSNLVTKAIKCIKDIISKRYENTLNILSNEEEELIYLNFVLGKLPLKYSLRPVKIPLEKSLHEENSRICLFVKDPKSSFKDLEIKFPFKLKVIDIQGLKMKYSRFQDRRNLLKEYDLFLCDSKIYFVLKKLLGKPFYVHKKYPIPIKINYESKEDLKNEIVNHIENCGIFYMTNGPNYSFKVAKFNMEKDDILKNILKSVHHLIAHILKWGVELQDVKSITVKGTNTIDLPIFNQLTKEEIDAFSSK